MKDIKEVIKILNEIKLEKLKEEVYKNIKNIINIEKSLLIE
jgi:hypothetical protein